MQAFAVVERIKLQTKKGIPVILGECWGCIKKLSRACPWSPRIVDNMKFLRTVHQLGIGDVVRHPTTGYVGLLISQDDGGKWLVEWFATKEWKILKRTLRTTEMAPALLLIMKAEAA